MIIALSARANALYRPVLADYEQAFALLARGKTGGVRERLARIAQYRDSVLRRTDAIGIPEWFAGRNGWTSNALPATSRPRTHIRAGAKAQRPQLRYLDEIEHEFLPCRLSFLSARENLRFVSALLLMKVPTWRHSPIRPRFRENLVVAIDGEKCVAQCANILLDLACCAAGIKVILVHGGPAIAQSPGGRVTIPSDGTGSRDATQSRIRRR